MDIKFAVQLRRVKNQIRYGRLWFFSFIAVDLLFLCFSNILASLLYQVNGVAKYRFSDHYAAIFLMIAIDIVVTFVFNTLERVLRRRFRQEIKQSILHVGISFALLTLILFSIKAGAMYSRVIVYLTYSLYLVFSVGSHIAWRKILHFLSGKKENQKTALLMTTDRFVDEGIETLKKTGIDIKDVFFLQNSPKDQIQGIPVVKDVEEAVVAICWNWIDRAYVYGLDHQMIPLRLKSACREMGVKIEMIDFEYRILDMTTIRNEDPKYGALSFLEGKRDIPFPIRRVYWITETEVDLHRGFHAHKLNCQLLFCPHGKIDILLDDGTEHKTTVSLEGPNKGLLLMPGLWREMVWRESGSVLCVLASEYYDPNEYIRNYDEFISYRKESLKNRAEKLQ